MVLNSCDGGYFFKHSDPTNVVDNLFGSDAGTCRACGPGKYGKFAETRRQKDTKDNAIGTCSDCPIGYYQGKESSPICHACPKGWYQNNNLSPSEFKYCFSCTPGRYQNAEGKTECIDCAENTASRKSAQTTECTNCEIGKAAEAGSVKCTPCDAGEAGTGTDGA